jgi:hypothetical protein
MLENFQACFFKFFWFKKKNFKKISIFLFLFFKNPEFWYGRGKILVKKNYTPGVQKP